MGRNETEERRDEMKLTYFDTLYKRDVTMIIAQGTKIEFKNNAVHFYSGGHGYEIELEYIKEIESLED